jgi:hypothetical protein
MVHSVGVNLYEVRCINVFRHWLSNKPVQEHLVFVLRSNGLTPSASKLVFVCAGSMPHWLLSMR